MYAKTERTARLPPKVYLVHDGEIVAEVKTPKGLKPDELCRIINKVLEEG